MQFIYSLDARCAHACSQDDSYQSLRSIAKKDGGYISQASAGMFIAYASQAAAQEMRQVKGVLAVQFVVSPTQSPVLFAVYAVHASIVSLESRCVPQHAQTAATHDRTLEDLEDNLACSLLGHGGTHAGQPATKNKEIFLTMQAAASTVSESLKGYLSMTAEATAPHGNATSSHSANETVSQTITLFALVAAKNDTVEALVAEWRDDLNPTGGASQNIITMRVLSTNKPSKVALVLPSSRLAECVRYIARREEVIWLEEEPVSVAGNIRASKIVQSGAQTMLNILWNEGIMGKGQMVSVADTGVDTGSAFFRDDSNPVLFCETDKDIGKSCSMLHTVCTGTCSHICVCVCVCVCVRVCLIHFA
jgi:hypothetical protein